MVLSKDFMSHVAPLSLLLVEDYTPLRVELASILEEFFGRVVAAEDGLEALAIYNKNVDDGCGFDLVITDIQMPNMNGVELSRTLKEIDAHQEIIVLSAHKDSDYLVGLINIGVGRFVAKPIDYDTLFEMIDTFAKKYIKKTISNKDISIQINAEFSWHLESATLKKNGLDIKLTRLEGILMELFVKHKQKPLSHSDIMQSFYSRNIDIQEGSIRNLVLKIRKKLPPNTLLSIYGEGYKLLLSK